MRIMKIKRVIALVALLSGVGLVGIGRADDSPSNESVAFAKKTSDLMLNELLAALFQEFNETTPDNVEHGKQAISLIFNDKNKDMRLVGVLNPLKSNDVPQDSFESTALTSPWSAPKVVLGGAVGADAVLHPGRDFALAEREVGADAHHAADEADDKDRGVIGVEWGHEVRLGERRRGGPLGLCS